jgi:aspartyl-tRNA(Asn)/glutamyl-tRNA(Gln) amidotransferase subunit C
MKLSSEEIKHVAGLAKLELTSEELDKYGEQLSAILSYIDQLQEVDVLGVEPTAQVTGLVNVWREDKIHDCPETEREAALNEAPELEDHQIKVKRVLE